MQFILALIIVSVFSLFALPSFAAFHLPEERERIRQSIREAQQKIQERRPDARPERAATTGDAMMKKDQSPEMMRQKREEFRTQIEAKRQEMKAKTAKNREELKNRLKTIKDERKKQAVERIDQALNNLNEQRTQHFTNVLEKLDQIVERIISRADKVETRGLNVSAAQAEITNAKNAIASAREAIKTQTDKTYALAITTEENLKRDLGKARQALHADLIKTQEAVGGARDAVHKAATTLAQIPRVDEESPTTPSGEQQAEPAKP